MSLGDARDFVEGVVYRLYGERGGFAIDYVEVRGRARRTSNALPENPAAMTAYGREADDAMKRGAGFRRPSDKIFSKNAKIRRAFRYGG